jgi:hypothetical protein
MVNEMAWRVRLLTFVHKAFAFSPSIIAIQAIASLRYCSANFHTVSTR